MGGEQSCDLIAKDDRLARRYRRNIRQSGHAAGLGCDHRNTTSGRQDEPTGAVFDKGRKYYEIGTREPVVTAAFDIETLPKIGSFNVRAKRQKAYVQFSDRLAKFVAALPRDG